LEQIIAGNEIDLWSNAKLPDQTKKPVAGTQRLSFYGQSASNPTAKQTNNGMFNRIIPL